MKAKHIKKIRNMLNLNYIQDQKRHKKYFEEFCYLSVFVAYVDEDYEKISESKSDLNISVGEIEKVFNEGRKIGIKIDF